MFPWLFNFFFDITVRQVNEKATGRGVEWSDGNGGEWEFKQVLYAGDKRLLKETIEHLIHIENG